MLPISYIHAVSIQFTPNLQGKPIKCPCRESADKDHVLSLFIGRIASACCRASIFFWLFFATAYRTPAKNPTPTPETDPNVTASPKNSIPEAATGSLFKAPTMLFKHINFMLFKFVSDLPVRCAARDADAPCGCVRDPNGSGAGECNSR